MDQLPEILKLVLPAVIVFLTSYYTLKSFLDSEAKKSALQLRNISLQVATPIRLQAYERLALFLERISPESLVMRVHGDQAKSARQLHSELVLTIRTEFEHNLSQQVYVSSEAWTAVRAAREEMIKLVNLASTQMADDGATGLDLGKAIFRMAGELQTLPTEAALAMIRKEAKSIF